MQFTAKVDNRRLLAALADLGKQAAPAAARPAAPAARPAAAAPAKTAPAAAATATKPAPAKRPWER
jgi:hypothetical protein